MPAADDQEAGHADSSRLWEHRRSRIKALDDKFRWKLNELGVCRILDATFLAYSAELHLRDKQRIVNGQKLVNKL